jgi:hypothetical protein
MTLSTWKTLQRQRCGCKAAALKDAGLPSGHPETSCLSLGKKGSSFLIASTVHQFKDSEFLIMGHSDVLPLSRDKI